MPALSGDDNAFRLDPARRPCGRPVPEARCGDRRRLCRRQGRAIGSGLKADPGTDVRDVSGYIVTPGLIDLHTHVYWGGTSLGIDAEEFCRTSGVTTAVDTGSAGPGNFAGFRKHVIEPSQVRILAYLHVSHAGIFGFSHRIMVGESEELRLMDPIERGRSRRRQPRPHRRHQGARRPARLGHVGDRAARYRARGRRTRSACR